MYRLPNLRSFIVQTRIVLAHKNPPKSWYSTPPPCPVKEPSPSSPCYTGVPPPPPPKPHKDRSLMWGSIATAIGVVSLAVYAKDKKEVRDWLSLYAPWFDDLIALMYQENKGLQELAYDCFFAAKRFLIEYDVRSGGEPKPCSLKVPPPEEKLDSGEKNRPVEKKDICEVARCMKHLQEKGTTELNKGIDACNNYSRNVRKTIDNYSPAKMKELYKIMDERKSTVHDVRASAKDYSDKLDNLACFLECGVDAETPEMVITRQDLSNARILLKSMRLDLELANDEALLLDEHLQKIQSLLNEWVHETQVFYPELQYDSKKPHITGDPDILLHHANRYVKHLREQLDEASQSMTDRINLAYESQPQTEMSRKIRDDEVLSLAAQAKADLNAELNEKLDAQRAANDKYLLEELEKRQKVFDDSLEAKLTKHEKEMKSKLETMINDAVAEEQEEMEKELAEMKRKIDRTEEELKEKSIVERASRRSQQLWTTGSALLEALQAGEPIVNVKKYVGVLQKISLTADEETDKLIQAVLKAIPDKVKQDGVVPESVLKQRYSRMEDVAKKVALVEHDGGPLPIYWLSYLQSLVLFIKLNGIPKEELNITADQNIPKHLDTFDLLQRARYWMNHGDVANALRYIEELQGASKGVASPWVEIARQHVETRQAAETIVTYAKALGIQFI